MAVRTKRLAAAAFPAVTELTYRDLYTCPAGETAIVKELRACATDNAMTITWFVNADNGAVPVNVWRPALAAGVPQTEVCWMVLQSGDTLRCEQQANQGRLRVLVSGTELEGTAD